DRTSCVALRASARVDGEGAGNMMDLALHYAKLGWPVFPLRPGDKRPFEGSHGFKDATLDLAQVEAWWSATPDATIGIATGLRSNVLVIDVDTRRNPNWLDELKKLDLPPTLTVSTWSGGWHLYFQFPHNARIKIGSDLVPGIDWRGEGGYVVAAGSVV